MSRKKEPAANSTTAAATATAAAAAAAEEPREWDARSDGERRREPSEGESEEAGTVA